MGKDNDLDKNPFETGIDQYRSPGTINLDWFYYWHKQKILQYGFE